MKRVAHGEPHYEAATPKRVIAFFIWLEKPRCRPGVDGRLNRRSPADGGINHQVAQVAMPWPGSQTIKAGAYHPFSICYDKLGVHSTK